MFDWVRLNRFINRVVRRRHRVYIVLVALSDGSKGGAGRGIAWEERHAVVVLRHHWWQKLVDTSKLDVVLAVRLR